MAEIYQVGRARGVQLDVLAGRLSELEAWTGAVVRIGREPGTPTPVNNLLYQLAEAC